MTTKIIPEFKVVDEEVDNCEWWTFIEGKHCSKPGTKAIQVLRDFPGPNNEYDCIAHLCDDHIDRAFQISKKG